MGACELLLGPSGEHNKHLLLSLWLGRISWPSSFQGSFQSSACSLKAGPGGTTAGMPSRPGTEPQKGLPVQGEKWVPPSTICAPLGFSRRPRIELTALGRLAVMPEWVLGQAGNSIGLGHSIRLPATQDLSVPSQKLPHSLLLSGSPTQPFERSMKEAGKMVAVVLAAAYSMLLPAQGNLVLASHLAPLVVYTCN